LDGIDAIGVHLAALESQPQSQPAPSAQSSQSPAITPPVASRAEELRLLWVDVEGVDSLLENITDTGARVAGLRRVLELADRSQHLAALLFEQLDPRRTRSAGTSGSFAHARSTAEDLRHAT